MYNRKQLMELKSSALNPQDPYHEVATHIIVAEQWAEISERLCEREDTVAAAIVNTTCLYCAEARRKHGTGDYFIIYDRTMPGVKRGIAECCTECPLGAWTLKNWRVSPGSLVNCLVWSRWDDARENLLEYSEYDDMDDFIAENINDFVKHALTIADVAIEAAEEAEIRWRKLKSKEQVI